MPIAASRDDAQPLRTTGVAPFAVEQGDPVQRQILAGRMGEFVDHAFDRPERSAGCDRPQLTGGGGVVRHFVGSADVVLMGTE